MKNVVSVIIVNYNGYQYVLKCVDSVKKSSYRDYEIIIVDNGSCDGSPEKIVNKYGSINLKVILLKKNYGPSYARNIGVSHSSGEYLCFLDNDSSIHKNCLKEAVKFFQNDPKIAVIQPKILLAKQKNKIDYVGDYIAQNGFLIQRATITSLDKGQYDKAELIFSAKSAGAFMKREAYEKTGGFDNDFFIYVEETDLAWRCWLYGYKNIFVPTSIVYHEHGTSSIILDAKQNEYNAKFHGSKNHILSLIKNLETKSLITILPVHIILWFGLAYYALINRKFLSFCWIHKGIFWNLLNIQSTLNKRRIIQKNRTINDNELFKYVMKKKPLKYFLRKIMLRKKIGNAERFIKTRTS